MTITARVDVEPSDIVANPQVFVGVIPQEYPVVKSNVTPGTPKDVQIEVTKGSNYHVIVYTVTGIQNGNAVKVVDDGAAEADGVFKATLRLK